MRKNKYAMLAMKLVVIAVASIIYAVGISLFLDPNNLAPGGVTGISVILNRLTGAPTGTIYFLINIPIVILGIWKFGFQFMGKTAFAVMMTSFFTNLFAGMGAFTDDPILAALFGSVLMATGIGLIFRTGATTGGTDIIIKIIRQHFPYLKTGFLFQCTDVIIVAISGLVFKNVNTALYALIAVLINGKALDYVLYGGDEAKMVYIITSKPNEIGKQIMNEIESGVTYLHGTGGWTGDEKKVIFCVVRRTQGPQVEELVKDGHLIGNHTYSHIQLTSDNKEVFREELVKTNKILKAITGENVTYIRPPYGSWDKSLEQDLNMFPVLWNVDPLDWCTPDAGLVMSRVLQQVEDGDIILLHDYYDTSVTAALMIVDEMKKQGYEFVTVEEILFD